MTFWNHAEKYYVWKNQVRNKEKGSTNALKCQCLHFWKTNKSYKFIRFKKFIDFNSFRVFDSLFLKYQ